MADSKVEKLAPGAKGKDGKEICRAFRNNGKCRFADTCKYEHSQGTPIEAPPRDYTPKGDCHNWTDNKECRFGERCRFLHGAEDKRTTYRVQKPANTSGEQEICRNFQNRGKCRFGDNCKHKHVASDKPAPKAAAGGNQSAGRPRRRRARGPRGGGAGAGDKKEAKPVAQFDKDGVEICRQHLKGKCKFGAECSYSHAASVGGSPAANTAGGAGAGAARKPREPRPPKDCPEFAAGQKCEYGDDCRFKHGANDKRDLNEIRNKRRAAGKAKAAGTA